MKHFTWLLSYVATYYIIEKPNQSSYRLEASLIDFTHTKVKLFFLLSFPFLSISQSQNQKQTLFFVALQL